MGNAGVVCRQYGSSAKKKKNCDSRTLVGHTSNYLMPQANNAGDGTTGSSDFEDLEIKEDTEIHLPDIRHQAPMSSHVAFKKKALQYA